MRVSSSKIGLHANMHAYGGFSQSQSNILYALDDFTSSLDKGFVTDVNFSKAFYSVPHVRLLEALWC